MQRSSAAAAASDAPHSGDDMDAEISRPQQRSPDLDDMSDDEGVQRKRAAKAGSSKQQQRRRVISEDSDDYDAAGSSPAPHADEMDVDEQPSASPDRKSHAQSPDADSPPPQQRSRLRRSNDDERKSADSDHDGGDSEVELLDVSESKEEPSKAAVQKALALKAHPQGATKNQRGAALAARSIHSKNVAALTAPDSAPRLAPVRMPSPEEQRSVAQMVAERNAKLKAKTSRKRKAVGSDDEADDDEPEVSPEPRSSEEAEWSGAEEEAEEEEDEESPASEEEADIGRRKSSRSAASKKRIAISSDEDEDFEDESAKPTRARATRAAAASKAKQQKPAAAAASSSVSKFFTSASGDEVHARLAAEPKLPSSKSKSTRQIKAAIAAEKRARGEYSERDSEDDAEDQEDGGDDDDDADPASRSGRPSRACVRKRPTRAAPAAREPPAGVRRSGRAHKEVTSYVEPSEKDLDESDAVIDLSAPADDTTPQSDDEADANEQSFFNDDDEPEQAAQQAHFTAALSRASNKKVAAARSKKVSVKANRKKKRARGSDDDDDSSEDSDFARQQERDWERKEGLLADGVEDDDGAASDDSGRPVDENPIDKILARRKIRVPADSRDPKSALIYRVEYFVKYKDLSYHECDWVDKTTIELWKGGKARLSNWRKHEEAEDSDIVHYHNDRRLFARIREAELKTFKRDEATGINALISNEDTRVNKKVHPSHKTVEEVWASVAASSEEGEADSTDLFFDHAYLRVDRIVGERYYQGAMGDGDGDDEAVNALAASAPAAAAAVKRSVKEYLVKWINLSYDYVTWEADTYVGDFLSQADVDRFRLSLEFPTKEQLRVGSEYTKNDLRPRLEVFKDAEHCTQVLGFKGGRQLRPYQLEGVNFLNVSFFARTNVILADEMGLGKTVQTVAFLRTLHLKGFRGPFLVLAPLSCTPHWQREIEQWTDMTVVRYTDNQKGRDVIAQYELQWSSALGCPSDDDKKRLKDPLLKKTLRPHVVVASNEIFKKDVDFFRRWEWQVLVMDEAHQIKNQNSQLHQMLQQCHFQHKVFLTGTPIQNNMGELFTLLSLLDPMKFSSRSDFDSRYGQLQQTGTAQDVSDLHKILNSMMLRRMKSDVEKSLPPREETIIEVVMTTQQQQYYRAVFEKKVEFLQGKDGRKTKSALSNVAMTLRLTCNHPYLIAGVEAKEIAEHKLLTEDARMEHAMNLSGKMILLDKLLAKLHAQGSRVLIFSQFVLVLDQVEDFLNWRGYKHERLDGSSKNSLRQASIDRFSKPNSDRFVFMLSTRAGGIGINLTSADTIIIFDSDWNPQGDVQAMARAHRIGQTKTVKVYRLVCANTYEAALFEKANLKLGLDRAVLHTLNDKKKDGTDKALDTKEVESLLRKGAAWMLKDNKAEAEEFSAANIDTILSKNTRTINTPDAAVGAASERSGLASFSHATFNAAGVGEVTIDLADPSFWDKMAQIGALVPKAHKPRALAAKRESKKIHPNLKGGRALPDDVDMSGLDDDDDIDIPDEIDSDDNVKQRGPRKSAASEGADEPDVECSDVGEDDAEKYFSGNWSKRDRNRFLAALLQYGYDRLSELKPYFYRQSLEQLQSMAISYIVFLWRQLSKSTKTCPCSALLGRIRREMLVIRRDQEAMHADQAMFAAETNADGAAAASPVKAAASSGLESKSFAQLAESFEVAIELTEPKFSENATFAGQHKRVLQDLNRLVVLHYLVWQQRSDLSAPLNGDAESEALARALAAPRSKYVQLPVPVAPPRLVLPNLGDKLSDKDSLPEPWWQPGEHDAAIIGGIAAFGYQNSPDKQRNVWLKIKEQPGLPFFGMLFGKRPPRKRVSKKGAAAADAAASTGDAMDIDHENSRSSEQKSEEKSSDKPAAAASAAATKASDVITIDDAAEPAAAAASSDSAAPTAMDTTAAASSAPQPDAAAAAAAAAAAVVDAADAAAAAASAAAPEALALVWPTNQKLKSRFHAVMDVLANKLRHELPSLRDYDQKKQTQLADSTAKPASSSRSAGVVGAKSSAVTDLISPDLQSPSSAPTWKVSNIRSVLTALKHYGQPTNKTLQLPAEYFTAKADVAPSLPPPPPISAIASPDLDGMDLASVKAAAADPAAYSFDDSYRQLRSNCSGHMAHVETAHLRSLVTQIISTAKTLQKQPKQPKRTAEELKAEKLKARESGSADSLESLIAAELNTPQKCKILLDEIQLLDDLKSALLHAANLQAQLLPGFKALPHPTYQPVVDDAALLVGVIKHGFGAWPKMREDPLLPVFKRLTLEPNPNARKAKEKKPAAAASEESKDSKEADAAAASDAKAAGDAKEEKEGEKPMHYVYNGPELRKRIPRLIEYLTIKQNVFASASSKPSPLKKSTPSPHATPTKQKTLGPGFGVKSELLDVSSPHKPSPRKSPKKSLTASMNGVGGKGTVGAKPKAIKAEPVKSEAEKKKSDSEKKAADSKSDVKPKLKSETAASATPADDPSIEEIDDADNPPSKPSPKKARTKSPAPRSSPVKAAAAASIANLDDSSTESVDDSPSPTPAGKKRKTESGAVPLAIVKQKPAPAASSAAASTPAKTPAKPAASAASSSKKPAAASSSSKKGSSKQAQLAAAAAGTSKMSSFFSIPSAVKPKNSPAASVASLVTAPNGGSKAPSASAASSPKKKRPAETNTIEIED